MALVPVGCLSEIADRLDDVLTTSCMFARVNSRLADMVFTSPAMLAAGHTRTEMSALEAGSGDHEGKT